MNVGNVGGTGGLRLLLWMARDSLVTISVSYTACFYIRFVYELWEGEGFSSQCKLHSMCFYIMFVYELWEGEGFSSQCKLHSMFLYNVCV